MYEVKDPPVSPDNLPGCLSAGLIGIPVASAGPNALCRVGKIKAAHIRGISGRSCSAGSPQVAALLKERGTWTRRWGDVYFSQIKAFAYRF